MVVAMRKKGMEDGAVGDQRRKCPDTSTPLAGV